MKRTNVPMNDDTLKMTWKFGLIHLLDYIYFACLGRVSVCLFVTDKRLNKSGAKLGKVNEWIKLTKEPVKSFPGMFRKMKSFLYDN